MRSVVIVGGGIAGLSTAYYLSKAGVRSTLIERRRRLGGVIQTERINGCVLEIGPDSFLAAKTSAMDLIDELGLRAEVIGSNDHLRVTYVRKHGRLIPLPDGLMLMIPTRIWPMLTTSLLSWGTKLRMGLEFFRLPSAGTGEDRSVADFVRDHYGQETVDYLAEPLLAGIYGGDPTRLSVSSVLSRFTDLESKYGSLTRGVLAAKRKMKRPAGRPAPPLFQTLRGGLGQLVDQLYNSTKPEPEVIEAEAGVIRPIEGGYQLLVKGEWMETQHLVLACQAYEAGSLLRDADPEISDLLNQVPYSSSLVISLGYGRERLGHPLNGFGFLVPKRERGLMMACTWVNTKFSFRVPPDKAVLRCFVGGENNTAMDRTDEDLVAAIRAELHTIMGVTAEPEFVRVARWPRSMAQYTVGHRARVRQIEARLARFPHLYLAGNAYDGIGVPDCVRLGKKAAEEILSA